MAIDDVDACEPGDDVAPYDVAVVGGGPAGSAAALWAARYRRRVALFDAGEPRNRWSTAAHGYLGLEGADPALLRDAGRRGLQTYHEIDVVDGCTIRGATTGAEAVRLHLDDGRIVRALRLVLATGVRDVFPDVTGFEDHFGRSVFTCPSCDGYEGQDRRVAVVGAGPDIADFAVGLLDWASSVVVVHSDRTWSFDDPGAAGVGLDDVIGDVVEILGRDGEVRSLQLVDGRTVPCEVVFWSMEHQQHSELAAQLGCAMTSDGCVEVDEHGATSVPGVYAAGDMTPGPHLIQLAAADGTRAGIAAATSLRGHRGSRHSPRPAPSPDDLSGLIVR